MALAMAFGAVAGAAAQTSEDNPSQRMALQVLSEICVRDMPDVAKIQASARRRWKRPQNLKGLDYWSIGSPGEGTFALGVGKQDTGHLCTVSFTGKAAEVTPDIENRFRVSKSQVVQGKRLWQLTLNGQEGMVFIEDHPATRFNINVGIFVEHIQSAP